MQNGLSVKGALLAKRPLLPSALCKNMVGLYPNKLFWLWPFMGMPCPKDRDQLWYGHLLGKRPRFNFPYCHGFDVTGQIS